MGKSNRPKSKRPKSNHPKSNRPNLIEELDNFKNPEKELWDTEVGSIKLCEEFQKGSRELEEKSRELRKKITKRRRRVIEFLSDILTHDTDLEGITPPHEQIEKIIKPPSLSKHTKITTSTDTNEVDPTVRIAGHINNDRCNRCEELDDEEVCGDNGKTYRTLCHAVNCAGLAIKDIAAGSCAKKVI